MNPHEQQQPAPSVSSFSSTSRQTALLHIQKALEQIPHKDALTEAMLHTPYLVETESDPLIFLRHTKFNAHEAAFRLAMYWFQRKRIFEDRAFLPLTLTGEGAMDDDDVAAYSKGYLCILPNTTAGRGSTVYCDQVNFHTLSSKERKRCIFYTWSVLSENASSAERGVKAIWYLESASLDDTDQEHADMMLEAFPISLHAVNLFCAPEKNRLSPAVISGLSEALLKLLGIVIFRNTQLYLELDLFQRKAKMIALGFREDEIPEPMGGSWNQLSVELWKDERLRRDYLLQAQFNERTAEYASSTAARVLSDVSRHHTLSIGDEDDNASPSQALSGSDRSVLSNVRTNMVSIAGAESHESGNANEDTKPAAAGAALWKDGDDEYTVLGLDMVTPMDETDEVVESSRRAFDEALALVPDEEKKAYNEAMRLAPELVKMETDALPFLRCNNFDATAAANQLVSYWNLRTKLFGGRALLPMIQGGTGALTDDDIVVLSSGSAALLPKDAKSRSVLIADRSRSLDSMDNLLDAKLRCYFYLMSVIAENQISQTDGYVILCILVTPRFTEFYDEFAGRCVEIQKVVPAHMKALHLLVCPPKTGKQTWVSDIVTAATERAASSFGNRFVTHTVSSAESFPEKLLPFGLSREGLPATLGGRWNYEEFIHWQRSRSQMEQDRKRIISNIEVLSAATSPPEAATSSDAPADDNSAMRKERKRKLNIIHSRQKRERRRNEMKKLQEACNALRDTNARTRTDNEFLESLLREARAIVMDVDMQRGRGMSSMETYHPHDHPPGGGALGHGTSAELGFGQHERYPPQQSYGAVRNTGLSGSGQSSMFSYQDDARGPPQERALMQKLLAMERLNQERSVRRDALARELSMYPDQPHHGGDMSNNPLFGRTGLGASDYVHMESPGTNLRELAAASQQQQQHPRDYPADPYSRSMGSGGGGMGSSAAASADSRFLLPQSRASAAAAMHQHSAMAMGGGGGGGDGYATNSSTTSGQDSSRIAAALLQDRLQRMQQQSQNSAHYDSMGQPGSGSYRSPYP